MRVHTYVDKAGEHRWRLVAANGNIIADSGEGYKNYSDMIEAIEAIEKFFINTVWEEYIIVE